MGTPRESILGACNWAQSKNNLSRIAMSPEAGKKRQRERKAGFEDAT